MAISLGQKIVHTHHLEKQLMFAIAECKGNKTYARFTILIA